MITVIKNIMSIRMWRNYFYLKPFNSSCYCHLKFDKTSHFTLIIISGFYYFSFSIWMLVANAKLQNVRNGDTNLISCNGIELNLWFVHMNISSNSYCLHFEFRSILNVMKRITRELRRDRERILSGCRIGCKGIIINNIYANKGLF